MPRSSGRTRRRCRAAARMRFSHHSSAASASGNERAATSSSTPVGASAITSTQPTSSSATRRLDSIDSAAPSRLPIRLQSSTTASTPVDVVDDAAEQPLGRPEEEVALELEDRDRVGVLREQVVLLGRAHAVRTGLTAVVAAAHDVAHLGLEAQRVEIEVGGDALADLDAAHAVPAGVERRGEHADRRAGRAAPRRPHRRRRSWPGARRCTPTRPRSRTCRRCSSR